MIITMMPEWKKYIQMQKMPINYLKNVVKTTEMSFYMGYNKNVKNEIHKRR